MAGTLCDAGPLVGMINPKDSAHQLCADTLGLIRGPLITTWPAFTEASYLLYQSGGWSFQRHLFRFLERHVLEIHANPSDHIEVIQTLMEKYRDTPMDLADASLVAAADTLGISRIFTLDSHFKIYRLKNGSGFEIIP